MSVRSLALLVALAWGWSPTHARAHGPEIEGEPGCDLCAQAKLLWARQRGLPIVPHGAEEPDPLGGPIGTGAPTLLGDTDVLNYTLQLELLLATQTIAGDSTITVRALAPAVSTIDIELASTFNVGAVTAGPVAGTLAPVSFTRPLSTTPQVMRIALDRPYNAGEQFQVRIVYAGTPQSGGLGSIIWTTTSAGNPLICTLSETRFAHTWWPVKENNSDKATGDLSFIVPDTLTVASQGLLVNEDPLPGARKRFRWVTGYPTAPYLFSFSASVYNRFSDTWTWTAPPGIGGTQSASTLLLNFIYPSSDTTTNRQQWLFNNQRMTALANLWGVYPFHQEKYGVYQFFFSGGMEHQTFSGQGGSGTIPFGANLSVHELGHQWFGDHVTCATWNDIWLNEGFATYSEALWGEFRPANLGTNGFNELKLRMSQRRPTSVADSVYVYDASTANEARIFSNNFSYRKGAWVNHMLRRVMGDTNYFAALRDYLATHGGSTASTADLQAACEARHGAPLGWFFNQWVYGIGAPTYQYAWRNVQIGAQNYAEVFIEQTQSAAWPFPSAQGDTPFVMPLELASTIGGSAGAIKVFNDARREHLLVPIAGELTSAALDPDDWVLAVASATSTLSAGSKTLVAFPPAPPKVIAATPAPGSTLPVQSTPAITVTVHEALSAGATGALTLTRDGQPIAGTASLDGASRTLTFTPASPLRAGAYGLTLADSATSQSAVALDGETNQALPSGDGRPGGAFFAAFTLTGCGASDVAGPGQTPGADGELTADDIITFVNWFFAADPRADVAGSGQTLNPDGQFTADDLIVFINRFFVGC
jgi:aminopeptidase N